MAISRISGNILQDNLQRGANLSIQGNLIYFDVDNNRVGVLTSTPADDFTVLGVANASNVRITSATANGVFYAGSTQLALTNSGFTYDGTNVAVTANLTAGNLISTGAVIGNVSISGNLVVANLVVQEYFTGNIVNISNTVTVGGNVTGGNIVSNAAISAATTVTATGNITGGNVISNAAISAATTITATGNINGGNLYSSGNIVAIGNVTAPNIVTNTVTTSSGDLTLNSASGVLQWDGTGNIVMNSQWINGLSNPQQSYDAATKQYVDDAVSSGIHIHTPVYVETPVALPAATYTQGGNTFTVTDTIAGNVVVFSSAANLQINDQLWFANSFSGIAGNTAYFVVSTPNASAAVLTTIYNGVPVANITSAAGLTQGVTVNSGIGATLTANVNAQLTVDGVNPTVGQRVLVYQQALAYENGVYVVSQTGNVSAPWILTRSSDTDTYEPDTSTGLDQGSYFYVQAGNTGAGESYVKTAPPGPFIIGYANIEFTQFSASQVYSANTAAGLVLNGTVFAAKVDNDTTAFDGSGNISVKPGANLVTPNIGNAVGNSLTVNGNITAANLNANLGVYTATLTATETAIVGNLSTQGFVAATGNVWGGNVISNAAISATTTISATGNITGGNLTSNAAISAATTVSATGNITGGNLVSNAAISAVTTISATGNITGGNVTSNAAISATTTVTATGNITGGNIISNGSISGITLTITGNAAVGNILTDGYYYANGAPVDFQQPAGSNTQIQYNLNSDFGASANLTYDQATNIFQVGYGTGGNIQTDTLTVTGSITGDDITAQGNLQVNGDAIIDGNLTVNGDLVYNNVTSLNIEDPIISMGRGANNTPLTTNDGKDRGEQLWYYSTSEKSAFIGYDNSAGNLLAAKDVTIANEIVTVNQFGTWQIGNLYGESALIVGNTVSGNLATAGQISATGNITGGNVIANALITGQDLSIANSAVITANVTAGNVSTGSGNISTGNITVTVNVNSGNIVNLGTIDSTGNITTPANVQGNYLIANSAVIGNVTITDLDVGNISATGYVNVTGNVTGGNLTSNAAVSAATTVSATGNITGGNLVSNAAISASTTITATGNITGGNVISNALISGQDLNIANSAVIVANVTAGNLSVGSGNINGGNITILANVTSGNIINLGTLTSTGNITTPANVQGNYLIANSAVVGNVSITDLYVANISATGQANVNGNVSVGNLISNSAVSAATTISATGNVTGGNIVSNALVTGANVQVSTLTANRVVYVGTDSYLVDSANFTFNGTTANIQGQLIVDNFTIDGTAITSNTNVTLTATTGNLVLIPASAGVTQITSTTALTIPTGNTAQRPGSPDQGALRFNTNTLLVEVYDGTEWDVVGQDLVDITSQIINGDGATSVFALNETATSDSILVSINGVSQVPVFAYSVTGNVITFTEAPSVADQIEIRFISQLQVVTEISNSAGNAIVNVSDATAQVNITGNLLPTANVTYDLGNTTLRWNDLYLAGNSIYLGNVILTNQTGNAIGFFAADGTTPATISSGGGLDVGTGNLSVGNIFNNNANGVGNIGSSGTYFNTIFAKATSAQYADLAEYFAADGAYQPGWVMIFAGDSEVTESYQYADQRLAGVISTDPAYIMNAGQAGVPIAMAGRVPCWVVGPVAKGDVLTTSGRAGHAEKLADNDWRPGVIVGKALETCGAGPHKIMIVIGAW